MAVAIARTVYTTICLRRAKARSPTSKLVYLDLSHIHADDAAEILCRRTVGPTQRLFAFYCCLQFRFEFNFAKYKTPL